VVSNRGGGLIHEFIDSIIRVCVKKCHPLHAFLLWQ
jgi:hypothetical protein